MTADLEEHEYLARLSSRYTDAIDLLCGRNDLGVRIAPRGDGMPPAQFLQSTARIEIDSRLLPRSLIDARIELDPTRDDHRARMAALHGVVCHQAGHAAHSRWTPPPTSSSEVVSAAVLLDEIRMEYRHTSRRPQDRQWLRCAAIHNLLCPHASVSDTTHGAARAALLLLGRVDAEILDFEDIEEAASVFTAFLDDTTLVRLRMIWTEALTVADDDSTSLFALATAWCDLLGSERPALLEATGDGQVADALSGAANAVTDTALCGLADAINTSTHSSGDQPDRDTSDEPGTKVGRGDLKRAFEESGGNRLGWRWRTPTVDEMRSVAILTNELARARYRERSVTMLRQFVPPGRLDLRAAMAGTFEEQACRVRSRPEWKQKCRQVVPEPPLRAALLIDTSGSMGPARLRMASAGWQIHTAVCRNAGQACMLTFGGPPRVVYSPDEQPHQVTLFRAAAGNEQLARAVDVADGLVGLSNPRGGARLLVVVSDGKYTVAERRRSATRLAELRRSGCRILWLDFGPGPPPFEEILRIDLGGRVDVGRLIGRELRQLLECC